jgi:hypothetical protein
MNQVQKVKTFTELPSKDESRARKFHMEIIEAPKGPWTEDDFMHYSNLRQTYCTSYRKWVFGSGPHLDLYAEQLRKRKTLEV